MISETFRDFYVCYFLSAQELGKQLRPSVDEETVKRWAEGEEPLPVGVEAQLYQMLLKLEKREADIWGKLSQFPDFQLRYLSYNSPQAFQDLQPDEWQFFFNELGVYSNFLVGLRRPLAEMELSERLIDIAMYRPEYETWLWRTDKQHSEENLWCWGEEEYVRHGSRTRHPKWEPFSEMFRNPRSEHFKTAAAKKAEQESLELMQKKEEMRAAIKKRLHGNDDLEDQVETRSDGTIFLKKRAQGLHSRVISHELLKKAKERLQQLRTPTAANPVEVHQNQSSEEGLIEETDVREESDNSSEQQQGYRLGHRLFRRLLGLFLTRKRAQDEQVSSVFQELLSENPHITNGNLQDTRERLRQIKLGKVEKTPENLQKSSEESCLVTEVALTSIRERLQQIKADTAAREESADQRF